MREEPFDELALHAFIDAALKENSSPEENDRSEGHESRDRALPITLLNTKIFMTFAQLVYERMAAPDAAQLLDDLRHELFQGVTVAEPQALYTQVHNCRKCPTVVAPPVLPVGNRTNPDILFVHHFPDQRILLERQFSEQLTTSGIPFDRCAHTSVVRCEPDVVRAAHPEEINNCMPYLLAEIQMLMPKLIVLLGAVPLQAFLGHDVSITKERGTIFWLGPWAFLPTYSLQYLQRRDTAHEEFLLDIRTAYNTCFGGDA